MQEREREKGGENSKKKRKKDGKIESIDKKR